MILDQKHSFLGNDQLEIFEFITLKHKKGHLFTEDNR